MTRDTKTARNVTHGVFWAFSLSWATCASAQDIQALSERLKVAGEKIRASIPVEKRNSDDARFRVLAQWHKVKERMITAAITANEISEQEADYLRIEIVKAEAAEAATREKDAAALKTNAAKIVKSMDRDGNGSISKQEASEDLKMFFARYDADKNGKIDTNEAVAIAEYVNRSEMKPEGYTATHLVNLLDKNGDGKIGKQEASDEIRPYFQLIDTNGDEMIDVDEAEALIK